MDQRRDATVGGVNDTSNMSSSDCVNCLHSKAAHTAQHYGACTAWVVPLTLMCDCEAAR